MFPRVEEPITPLPDGRLFVPIKRKVPPVTVANPVYEFDPERIKVPLAVLVILPVPEILFGSDKVSVRSNVIVEVFVTSPLPKVPVVPAFPT